MLAKIVLTFDRSLCAAKEVSGLISWADWKVDPSSPRKDSGNVEFHCKGNVGFHCNAWEMTLPSKPTPTLIGATSSLACVASRLTSSPSFLLSRKRKLLLRLAVNFRRREVSMMPFWSKYPAETR